MTMSATISNPTIAIQTGQTAVNFDSVYSVIDALTTESDNIRETALKAFDDAIAAAGQDIGAIIAASTKLQMQLQAAKAKDDATKEFGKNQADGVGQAFPR